MTSCEAKVPVPFIGGPLFLLCGEPSTAVYDYWCACGRHTRRGATCEAHRPAEDKVGCVRCFTELGPASHDCPMTFAEVEQGAPSIQFREGGARCSLCKLPAVLVEGRWRHAEAADEVFCALLFPRARGVGPGGSE